MLVSNSNTIPQQKNASVGGPETHQAKLEQKRAEKKQAESGDLPGEKREMVLHGAALKCPYAQGPGKLVVTSNEILLQDQLFATQGDGNNRVNLQFEGTCGHPNFSGQTPPPCKSVINLTSWYNLGTTNIQEQRALIKASCIDCNPTPNAAVASPIPTVQRITVPGNECNNVINAYWTEDNTGNRRATGFPYKRDDRVRIFINIATPGVGKSYEFTIWNNSSGFDEEIYKTTQPISNERSIISFNLNGTLFTKGAADRLNLYFTVKEGACRAKEYCNSSGQWLKVHLIRYIPGIMQQKGWQKGFALQEKWFNAKGTDDPFKTADIATIVEMDWVLGFARAKAVYDAMIAERIWVNAAGRNALVEEIKKMKLQLPAATGQAVPFGDLSTTATINFKGQAAPVADRHHYQERPFNERVWSVTDTSLDDLYAALANFVFRLACKGTITRSGNRFLIRITEVGIYVRDSFDFNDPPASVTNPFTWTSQALGYWSAAKKDASTGAKDDSYYYVNNASYQAYRADMQMGGDFLVYSDVKTIRVADSFTVPVGALT